MKDIALMFQVHFSVTVLAFLLISHLSRIVLPKQYRKLMSATNLPSMSHSELIYIICELF